MVIIELVLQKRPHLSQFLITLSLQRLYEVSEFSVVFIRRSQLIPHFHPQHFLSFDLFFQTLQLLDDFAHRVLSVVMSELKGILQLRPGISLRILDGLRLSGNCLQVRFEAVYLRDQEIHHPVLDIELLVQVMQESFTIKADTCIELHHSFWSNSRRKLLKFSFLTLLRRHHFP